MPGAQGLVGIPIFQRIFGSLFSKKFNWNGHQNRYNSGSSKMDTEPLAQRPFIVEFGEKRKLDTPITIIYDNFKNEEGKPIEAKTVVEKCLESATYLQGP
jgi:hypothetical protein